MTSTLRKLFAGLGTALLLAACGGGGDDDGGGSTTPVGQRPVAVIAAHSDGTVLESGATVPAGTSITLDANGSSTPSGSLTYTWQLDRKPEGSQASFDNAGSAITHLTPDLAGEYSVSLAVNNGTASATTVFNFSTTSTHPVAAITYPQFNAPIGTIQLDGTASQPPTGGDRSLLRYTWTLVTVPAGSTLAKIADTESSLARPRFDADVAGRYEVRLQVSHGDKTSLTPAVAIVNVQEPHKVPKAVASISGSTVRGERITLDGSASELGSGAGPLQYRWEIGYADVTLPVTIENANQAVATVVLPQANQFSFRLRVFDGISSDVTTTESIYITKPADAPNTPPVVKCICTWDNHTLEYAPGAVMTLSATAYDIDGDSVSFEWSVIGWPSGVAKPEIVTTTRWDGGKVQTITPVVTNNTVDEYTVQVRAQDSHGAWSAPVTRVYRVLNGPNQAPTAKAAAANGLLYVQTGTVVNLTGANSTDPDYNRLSYQWTLVDSPDGSQAALQRADTVTPNFTADQAGTYQIRLDVTDSHGAIGRAPSFITITAKAQNNAPNARPATVAAYDSEQPLLIQEYTRNVNAISSLADVKVTQYAPFRLLSNSYDPDGEPLAYLWTLTKLPANGQLAYHHYMGTQGCLVGGTFSSYTTTETKEEYVAKQITAREWTDCRNGNLYFAPATTGTYDVELLATDGVETVGPFRFSLQAATRDDYPTLLLEEVLDEMDPAVHGNDWQLEHLQDDNWDFYASDKANRIDSRQRLFPLDRKPNAGGLVRFLMADNGARDYIYRKYRLTAKDRDYTIADLAATSETAGFAVRFEGLTNNQVIRKGESVEFKLVLGMPAALPEAGAAFRQAGNGIKWTFRIAEKTGWTFSFTPSFSDMM